jgi:tetratricopeptide (TPR) repeat protein
MNVLVFRWYQFKARVLLICGQIQAALQVFDTMLGIEPSNEYALSSKAHLLAQGGGKNEALVLMQQLTQLASHDAVHWFNYGFLLEELTRYDEAQRAFEQATQINPKLDRAWYGMALVLIRTRRFDDAVQALKKTTQLQPMSPHGWYQLARVHVDRHEPDEATKIIRHLKSFEPKVAAQLERETGLTVAL